MRKDLFRSFLCSIVFLVSTGVIAQTINGTVSSEDGPLPGATVQVQGTDRGVSTDFDGNFSIEAGTDDVLIVSFVGFSTQEVAVSGQDNILITLEAGNELDEIVVTGYGSIAKRDATGAVDAIGTESFDLISADSPAQLLRGKVAGYK